MKRFIFACLFAVLVASSAFGASSSELKKMSTFVSNFTEIGMNNFDVDEISDSELARFGIWHNWQNNFKTRIQRCPDKNCPYGGYVIDKKFVAESVKKFFNLEIEHQSAPDDYGYYCWSRSIEKPLLRILRKYGLRWVNGPLRRLVNGCRRKRRRPPG